MRAAVRTALIVLVSAAVGLGSSLASPRAEAAAPSVTVTKVVEGLSVPWDVTWIGGLMMFDQRAGGIWSKWPGASAKRVRMALPKPFVQSESGMLGLVADPKAATNKYFYTCMAVANSNGDPQGHRGLEVASDDQHHGDQGEDAGHRHPAVVGPPLRLPVALPLLDDALHRHR